MAGIFKAALAWSACCQYLGLVDLLFLVREGLPGAWCASSSHMSDKYLQSRWGGWKIIFFCGIVVTTVFKAWSATTAWPGRDLAGAWSAGIDHTTYYGPSSLLPRPSQLLKWRYKYDLGKLSGANIFFCCHKQKKVQDPLQVGQSF